MSNSVHLLQRTSALVVIILLASSPLAPAQDGMMYTWKDENGVVHFSDRAPEGQDVQAQALPESPPPGSVNPTQSAGPEEAASQPSVAEQRRQEIAQKAQENRARQEANQAQCDSWRAELARIEPNRRVFFTNEQGETERMDDVKRTDRVAELHRLIEANCN
jgi:hypothetical protein